MNIDNLTIDEAITDLLSDNFPISIKDFLYTSSMFFYEVNQDVDKAFKMSLLIASVQVGNKEHLQYEAKEAYEVFKAGVEIMEKGKK